MWSPTRPVASPRPPGRQTWPRIVGAIALTVLAACAAMVLTAPSSRQYPLVSRSNWVLANALPSRADFPIDWGYSLSGVVGRAIPPDPARQGASGPANRSARYTPPACADLPEILSGPGNYAASVRVDRDPDPWWIAKAVPADAAATGETDEHGPTAGFVIWAVDDGRALIRNYLRWLRHCRSYRVTAEDLFTHDTHDRSVTTVLEKLSGARSDAAVAVTRSFVRTDDSHARSFSYRVSYYAVRGLLLECSTNMAGADAETVARLAAQTVHRLRAL